jgi:hypothetical protein
MHVFIYLFIFFSMYIFYSLDLEILLEFGLYNREVVASVPGPNGDYSPLPKF